MFAVRSLVISKRPAPSPAKIIKEIKSGTPCPISFPNEANGE